jgi:hypothetical protein
MARRPEESWLGWTTAKRSRSDAPEGPGHGQYGVPILSLAKPHSPRRKRDGSDWIGEWHTHTVGRPLPSKLDRRTYEGIVTAADLEFQRFFSLILRANDESWEDLDIVLWEIDRQGIRPRSLLVVNVE